MTTLSLAAAGTAVALYYYSNSRDGRQEEFETHANAYRAPKSFFEDLYFFAEALRYMYGETLYKWKTADLLLGLYYLCSRTPEVHPLEDIGRHGSVFGIGIEDAGAKQKARMELQAIERCFVYNSCLRERRPIYRRRRILEVMGIREEDFLKQAVSAGILKPSYVLVKDEEMKAIILAIRGTHSVKDAFTSLTGASKPHHVVDSNGVTLGYSHFGMLAAARWMKSEVGEDFRHALETNPEYRPLVIGHSLGGGTAAMLTMMLREQGGVFMDATCISIACPACMTLELAESCKDYVTTIVNGCDIIPTISAGSADILREEVTQSSWYADFKTDMRSSRIFRAFESGIRGVGTATSWTAIRLSACYTRRKEGHHKRRKVESDDHTNGSASVSGSSANAFRRRKIDENSRDDRRLKGGNSWWVLPRYLSNTASYVMSSLGKKEDSSIHEKQGAEDRIDLEESRAIDDLAQEEGHDSLSAEANFRMRAVKDAVHDAEIEEMEHEKHSSAHEDAVPSIIRPGAYGNVSPSKKNLEWKRSMYPAGRIMHFVPASVVPGYENAFDDANDDELNGCVFEDSSHSRRVSELSFDDFLGVDEALGATSSLEARSLQEPLPQLKPAPGPAPKNMILLDHIPQSLYGRIRLSSSILSDHVIPNYLRSLESFKQNFDI
ncbi:hypothetical protein M9434_002711 [Picochlorum sp. BPE23]|nr:hypothetical protein M9434_002711 [Picochlorum sp. BPE23]